MSQRIVIETEGEDVRKNKPHPPWNYRVTVEVPCQFCLTAETPPPKCVFPVFVDLVLDEMVEKGRSVDATLSREQMRAVLVAALGLEETNV